MKILIFGSCVTRDIFRGDFFNGKDNIFVDKYFARNSLISLNSQPIKVDLSQVKELDPFQKRLLSDDLTKNFYTYIREKKKFSHLMIDFVDERFHLYKWGDQNYLNRSNEFIAAKLSEKIEGSVVSRFTPETTELWKKNCLVYIQKLQEVFKPGKIILHKAFWKTEYLDNGTIRQFENQEEILRQNDVLKTYYDFFAGNFADIHILDLNDRGFRADAGHVWGLGEMHYEQGYYDACWKYLYDLEYSTWTGKIRKLFRKIRSYIHEKK